METPSRHSFNLDGSTRVFPIPSPIKGDNYCRLEVDGNVINDRAKYDIVNNSVVFIDVADVPSGSQLDVLVVQSEEALGQLTITTNIDIVAQDIDSVNLVGNDIDNVNTVADDITNVNTTATNIANVNTVAGINANVTTVAGISANVTTVAGIDTDVTAVAGNNTNVTTVADNIASVNTVATNIADVITVANDLNEAISEIETAANDLNEAVSEIDTVAVNIDNVNTVGTNITDVNAVADNMSDINDVQDNLTAINTVATNVTDVTNFADVYYGASATAPTTRRDGSALQAGDLWFDTANGYIKVYTGSDWLQASVQGASREVVTATEGQTSVLVSSGYNVDQIDVYLNGQKMITGSDFTATDGQYITFLYGLQAGDKVEVISMASIATDEANLIQRVTFTADGATATFDTTHTLVSKSSIMVSVNGVVQNATAFSVSGTTFTMNELPEDGDVLDVMVFGVSPTSIIQQAESIIYTPVGETSTNVQARLEAIDAKLADTVSVKDFGAVGDGVTDDTAAIQAAVDSVGSLDGTVYLPAGDYLITSSIVVNNCSLMGDPAINATRLIYNATDGSAAVEVDGYYNRGFYSSFKNLTFKGVYTVGSATDNVGLYLHNSGAEDIDVYVDNCQFNGFRKSIFIKGRGLSVRDSAFVITLDAFYIDRVDPVNEGSEQDQKISSGFRVYQFYNNRFHAMGAGSIITNVGTNAAYLRGLHFEGNYIDTSARIMNGPCRESTFTSNVHMYPDSSQTLFKATTGEFRLVSITGNTFTSFPSSATTTARFYDHIMDIAGGIHQCSITGNTIGFVQNEVIVNGSHMYDTVIANNSFAEICNSASSTLTRPITIAGDCYRSVVSNNVFSFPGATVDANLDYLIYISGSQSTNTFAGNRFNTYLVEDVANVQGELVVGGGLYVGGTDSSNLLNSYKRGDWTPQLDNGTNITYNSRTGRYIKVGNLVFVTAELDISNSDSDGSGIHLAGLPFPSSANQQQAISLTLGQYTSFLGAKSLLVRGASMPASSTAMFLHEGNNDFITYSDVASSGLLYYSAIYETDA